jgi:hypothetical protein
LFLASQSERKKINNFFLRIIQTKDKFDENSILIDLNKVSQALVNAIQFPYKVVEIQNF